MSKNSSMWSMAGIGIAAAIGFVFALSSIGSNIIPVEDGAGRDIPLAINQTFDTPATQALKKFSSVDELKNFLHGLQVNSGQFQTDTFFGGRTMVIEETAGIPQFDRNEGSFAPAPSGEELVITFKDSSDYSTTNVQVQNVDEPDFLKNDGKYAYVLSGDRLTIAQVYPPSDAEIVIKVGLDIQQGQYLQNMFLNNNTLVIFYQEYGEDYVIQEYDFAPVPVYSPKTHALVMDVSDREDPEILNDYEITGSYNNARMIGERAYLITTSDLYDYNHPIIPKVMESSRIVAMPEIYYFDNPELYYSFNTVTSIDISAEAEDVNSQTYMMNPASTLYVSEDNIYIAYEKNLPYNYYETRTRDRFFEVIVPLLPDEVQDEIESIEDDDRLSRSEKWDEIEQLLQDTYNNMSERERNRLFEDIQEELEDYDSRIQQETQQTVIHRIAIGEEGSLDYGARGEVPGRLLNQFSMDEHDGRFRVATTSDIYSPHRGSSTYNNVYVLDNSDMEVVGSLEEIAKDESIFAARFMGDRLYLVTFERIDPFFVIDLSEDEPKVLGALKLPGFSNYLHPYDEDHIIGIGRETKENEYGNVETLGVKLALFDVSDVSKPVAVDTFQIGGMGTESEVLYDHKALLFDKSKDVLSLPITIYPDYSEPVFDERGDILPPVQKTWRGFYVFSISPEEGFDLKGKVEHFNDAQDYYYSYSTQGSRSFYIEDVLYTVTLNNLIKMNSLDDLEEIDELDLGSTGQIIRYVTPESAEGANATATNE